MSLRLGASKLGLVNRAEPAPPGRVTLWIYADDVDAEIERLRAAGVTITSEPADMEWGERLAAVEDPDGNTIQLGQEQR